MTSPTIPQWLQDAFYTALGDAVESEAVQELVVTVANRFNEQERTLLEHRIYSRKILISLADMYGQYCHRPYGHNFMSAGESAIEILEDHGLATESSGVNWKAVNSLETEMEQMEAALATTNRSEEEMK